MTNCFKELTQTAKARCDAGTGQVSGAAAADFTAQVDARAALGAAFMAARKKLCLTQTGVSAMTGIHQAEISRIERGTGNPTAATLLRLADALGQRLTLAPIRD